MTNKPNKKLATAKKAVASSPEFIQEKYDHTHYCVDGEIPVISYYKPFRTMYRPCKYCEKMEALKKGKPDTVVDDGEKEYW